MIIVCLLISIYLVACTKKDDQLFNICEGFYENDYVVDLEYFPKEYSDEYYGCIGSLFVENGNDQGSIYLFSDESSAKDSIKNIKKDYEDETALKVKQLKKYVYVGSFEFNTLFEKIISKNQKSSIKYTINFDLLLEMGFNEIEIYYDKDIMKDLSNAYAEFFVQNEDNEDNEDFGKDIYGVIFKTKEDAIEYENKIHDEEIDKDYTIRIINNIVYITNYDDIDALSKAIN